MKNKSKITTTEKRLVENLAGYVSLPAKLQGKNIDQIIETTKAEYFKKLFKEFKKRN